MLGSSVRGTFPFQLGSRICKLRKVTVVYGHDHGNGGGCGCGCWCCFLERVMKLAPKGCFRVYYARLPSRIINCVL